MVSVRSFRTLRAIPFLIAVCLLGLPVYAKYSGGSGTAQDPYQIATAADLIALGETPDDYDKHFILTTDIDLDPNLPGGKVFDKGVIAPARASAFTGVFDGGGHTIRNLTIRGGSYLGLFGQVGSWDAPIGEVRNLGLVDVNIVGSGYYVGGLAGRNAGTVTQCYSTGVVSGEDCVGGLVGMNGESCLFGEISGSVTQCYSTGAVSGNYYVGGLVGENYEGFVTLCYSTGAVTGGADVGGLVGENWATVLNCYSTGVVTGGADVGGLVGSNGGTVTQCFWDSQTSGQATSAGGTGKTTAEMQTAGTFLWWGSYEAVWTIDEGRDYPRLAWEEVAAQIIAGPTYGGGMGTPDSPYLIYTAEQLNSIGLARGHWDKQFKLMADIDLSVFDGKDGRPAFNIIAPAGEGFESLGTSLGCPSGPALVGMWGVPFTGVFDGNGHTIRNFTYTSSNTGGVYGLFGYIGDPSAQIKDLGLVHPNVMLNGTGGSVGCLVGHIGSGVISGCYVQGGSLKSDGPVGGLVGWNNGGTVTQCHSTGVVIGGTDVGGLVGWNNGGTISQCHSTGMVIGDNDVGGLVGWNNAAVTDSYDTGAVSGTGQYVGGLVGVNKGAVTRCYSTGAVIGGIYVGGLVGIDCGRATGSFWDIETSGQAMVWWCAGQGKTTAEMQTAKTFLDAGWDFVGETANGTEDIWKIVEGQTYPLLSWQKYSGGTGEPNDQYQIATAADLIALGETPEDYDKHFLLTADIDLDPNLPGRKVFDKAVIAPLTYSAWDDEWQGAPFSGVFDADGHTVSNLTINGNDYLGLFGHLASGAEVRNLGVVDVNIIGSRTDVGGLVGANGGTVTQCYCSGTICGKAYVGGLVAWNGGTVSQCYSAGAVSGNLTVAGLVGSNFGSVANCHSTGMVSGDDRVGGLVGENYSTVTQCHTSVAVSGESSVGGLVGENSYPTLSETGGTITECYSAGTVSGNYRVGGLVGDNAYDGEFEVGGAITQCCSIATVSGDSRVGGLVGENTGIVNQCYSTGTVSGSSRVGGLVGYNSYTYYFSFGGRIITQCYSTGTVSGGSCVGGLVGENRAGIVTACFWDIGTSGCTRSDGGIGRTAGEMQTAKTFLDAGWDFIGEIANGPNDVWKIAEGLDYPRLWWEPYDGRVTVVLGQVFTVTLESNPSTGYRWEWVDHQDSIVEQMGQAKFKPRETGDPPLVGAAGWESFDFKAVHPGQMTLKLVYRRPWEEGVEPLKTFSLQVTVP